MNELVERALRDLQGYWMCGPEETWKFAAGLADDLTKLIQHIGRYDAEVARLLKQFEQRMREEGE